MKINTRFLNESRQVGDHSADFLVLNCMNNHSQSDLYSALRLSEAEISSSESSGIVINFLKKQRTQPVWFDEHKLLAGQEVFQSYAAEIMALLGAMSLPYCYAASPGNKALYLSDKMRQSPGKRLLDTAHFIIHVSTPGSLDMDQHGHININKTRLIHALARYYVQKGTWNMAWGLPINQEDMAGTNLAFSILILLGLQQMGFVLSDKQKDDFIFLWRYIGYQLHIDEHLLPSSVREAYQLAQLIKKRNFKKSVEGVELTKELLSYYRTMAPPDKAYFVDAQVRYFLGTEVAAYVGLEPDYFKDKVTTLVSGFKEWQNLFSIHTSTYQAMMDNHLLLKMNIQEKKTATQR